MAATGWPELIDPGQDLSEQLFRDSALDKQEREVATVVEHVRADFDQLLAQGGERPVLDLFRRAHDC